MKKIAEFTICRGYGWTETVTKKLNEDWNLYGDPDFVEGGSSMFYQPMVKYAEEELVGKPIEYIVVSGSDETEINEFIRNGYQPYGTCRAQRTSFSGNIFTIAMVKYDEQ